jgi:hypothetical protein
MIAGVDLVAGHHELGRGGAVSVDVDLIAELEVLAGADSSLDGAHVDKLHD